MNRQGPDERNWFVVATASGEAEASIYVGLLKSAGIPVWVYRESAGAAIGLGVGILGTVFIMTPEEFHEDALALLEGEEPVEIDLEGEDENTIIAD